MYQAVLYRFYFPSHNNQQAIGGIHIITFNHYFIVISCFRQIWPFSVSPGNPEEGELRPQLLDRFGMHALIRFGNPWESSGAVDNLELVLYSST